MEEGKTREAVLLAEIRDLKLQLTSEKILRETEQARCKGFEETIKHLMEENQQLRQEIIQQRIGYEARIEEFRQTNRKLSAQINDFPGFDWKIFNSLSKNYSKLLRENLEYQEQIKAFDMQFDQS